MLRRLAVCRELSGKRTDYPCLHRCKIVSNHDPSQYSKMSLVPLETSQQTGGNSWTRNSTEEISLFHNKINGLVISVDGVNVARDFARRQHHRARSNSTSKNHFADMSNEYNSSSIYDSPFYIS